MKRSVRGRVPVFSLYGERSPALAIEALHVEDIQSRSRKYQWRISRHRHAGLCQLLYVDAGAATAQIEDTQERVTGPALFVIPSGAVHGFEFRADTRGHVLSLDLDRLLVRLGRDQQAPVTRLFSMPRSLVLDRGSELAERLADLFPSLQREFAQPDSGLLPVSAWLACAILWIVASAWPHPPRSGAPFGGDLERMRRFREMVERRFLEHWPVSRYARELAVSGSSLNRLCASLAGRSASDLIQQRLALESRRRLIYVAGSVASIAAELGFKDPAYFCRFFRKHAGMSPGAFRRRQGGE